MKHVVNVGTDVASLCFFDRAALPEDVDEQLRADHTATRTALVEEGRVGWLDYDSDGGYVMHFHVDESVPEHVKPYLTEPRQCARFRVPSGTLWACGAEYLANDPERGARPRRGLARYPHMGAKFELPAGDYAMQAWNVEWPPDTEEEAIDQELGPTEARRRNRWSMAIGFLIMALLALGVPLLFSTVTHLGQSGALPAWYRWGWPAFLVLLVTTVLATRRFARVNSDSTLAAIEQEHPSFVVHLQRLR